MFNGLGTQEMVLFGIIALMLFGSRLPQIARQFGGTYRELRRKVDEFQREFREWDREPLPPSRGNLLPPEDDAEKSAPTTPKFVPPSDDDD
ncbi:MAG: twin-arginine translocase TatA/TatE family subunit [Planctomycetales bacterium]|nr:twin-arginine translocase TatA/TatE family subunit [Planctomycetales bacterium]